jgi:phosphohistidine phosphatase SixA
MSKAFRALLGIVMGVALTTPAFAQGTVFVVRHAERADSGPGTPVTMGSDPHLSDAGRERAAALAVSLKDAGVTTIFVTEYKRTQETAASLAKALGLTPVIVRANDIAALLSQLKSAKGNALVVGHSNTVPEIIKGLGVTTPVTVADTEFDHLFVVVGPGPQLIHLRYR